jgi:hypothetical protein
MILETELREDKLTLIGILINQTRNLEGLMKIYLRNKE